MAGEATGADQAVRPPFDKDDSSGNQHEVRVAAVTADLPKFEPPLDEAQGFDIPYADRLAVELAVLPADSLASIYRRAIDDLQPRVDKSSQFVPSDAMEVVRWAWFYEPADANGIPARTKAWETAEDLVTVDELGLARWHRSAEDIPFADLVRASEHGLLRGDPFRPYLVLVLPQGGDAFQTAWEVVQFAWAVTGHVLTARELGRLIGQRLNRQRMQQSLDDGIPAVAKHSHSLAQRGGGPLELARTLERKPWPLEELRMLLGVDNDEDVAAIVGIFGLRPNADGLYELSEDEESRLLDVIAREARRAQPDWDDETPLERLKTLLTTGDFPDRDW